jgi:hypothetical protein
VKTQHAGKGLASTVVICELRILAVALKLLVVPSGVFKWPTNRISNPKPRRESLIRVTIQSQVYRNKYWMGVSVFQYNLF